MTNSTLRRQIRALPSKLFSCLTQPVVPNGPVVPILLHSIVLSDEILRHILAHLTQDTMIAACTVYPRFTLEHIRGSSREPSNADRCACITTLYRFVLVSRAWYTTGIRFLYNHPVLMTFDQTRLFRLTVERCAHLAWLVRLVSIIDNHTRHSPQSDATWLPRLQPTIPDCFLSHISRIFHYCSSLEAVSISLQAPVTHLLGIQWTASVRPRITQQLRSLNISGSALLPSFIHLALPNLEELSIESVPPTFITTPQVKIPLLPKLSALRLSRIQSWAVHHALLASTKSLPSLVSLELYENVYDLTSHTAYSLPPTLRLKRFYALGTTELSLCGRSWLNSRAISRVKDLSVGVSSSMYEFLADWSFPSSLESITWVVNVELPHETLIVPQPTPLQHIYWCLERNFVFSTNHSLNTINFNALSYSGRDLLYHPSIEPFVADIENLCSDYGIPCTFSQLSKSLLQNDLLTCSDSLVVIEGWAAGPTPGRVCTDTLQSSTGNASFLESHS